LSLSGTVTTTGNLSLTGTLSAPVSSINDSTTIGRNLVKLSDPSQISFLRVNEDNTVSALNATDFRTAIGAATSGGIVQITAVSPLSISSGSTPTLQIAAASQFTSGTISASDKIKLDGIESGAQANVATNLGLGTITATVVPVTSSTGTTVNLPAATQELAGIMTAADKLKLDTSINTNLGVGTRTTTVVPITSSTGTSAILTSANQAQAGIMTANDKIKLDSLESPLNKEANLVFASPNGAFGNATFRALAAQDLPGLDASKIISGTIDAARLPSYVDDVIEAENLAALPATGESGKIYVTLDTNQSYRWGGSSYVLISSGAVLSVAGKTGVVTLDKSDIGLSNIDNTSDVNKPISTAQQTALDSKASITDLNLKANSSSPVFTGAVSLSGGNIGIDVVPPSVTVGRALQILDAGAYLYAQNGLCVLSNNIILNNSATGAIAAQTRGATWYQQQNGIHSWIIGYTEGGGTPVGGQPVITPTALSLDITGLNSSVPIKELGNQVLHAGNYTNYAIPSIVPGTAGNVLMSDGSNWTSQPLSLTPGGTFSIDITGNAATATTLQNPRTINGVSFNGSSDIVVADATKLPLTGGTLTGSVTINGGNLGFGVTPGSFFTGNVIQIANGGATIWGYPAGTDEALAAPAGAVFFGNNFTADSSSNGIYQVAAGSSVYGQSDGVHVWFVSEGEPVEGGIINIVPKMQLDTAALNSLVPIKESGNQVLHEGNYSNYPAISKAWVNFNGTGTVSIRSSFNVSSITDNGTGDYTVNFTNPLTDTNYAVVAVGSTVLLDDSTTAKTTSAFRYNSYNFAGTKVDGVNNSVAVFR
jgi:hypothetical protein